MKIYTKIQLAGRKSLPYSAENNVWTNSGDSNDP
jgi:hypothetical protein